MWQVSSIWELRWIRTWTGGSTLWKGPGSAKAEIMVARRLVANTWGLTPNKTKWLYEGIVRPALDYACHIWFKPNPPKWMIKELKKIQRLALVCITSCFRSTPSVAMERIVNLTPIDLHLKTKACSTSHRIRNAFSRSNWDGIGQGHSRGHAFLWENYDTHIKAQETKSEYNFSSFNITLTRSSNISHERAISVYSDGSKSNTNTGAGWVIYVNNREKTSGNCKLPQYTTVYEAEVLALTSALRIVNGMSIRKSSHVNVYVDNKALLHMLTRTKIIGQLNINLCRAVKTLHDVIGPNLTLNWVKSHSGIGGNCRADTLAKTGAINGQFVDVGMGPNYIKDFLNRKHSEEWNNRWPHTQGCRQSKELIKFTPDKDNERFVLGRGRNFCRTAVALLTGHNNLKYHTFLRNDASDLFSPVCRFCSKELETSQHLLEKCWHFHEKRRSFQYGPQNPKKGPDIAELMDLAEHLGILGLVVATGDDVGDEMDSDSEWWIYDKLASIGYVLLVLIKNVTMPFMSMWYNKTIQTNKHFHMKTYRAQREVKWVSDLIY